MNNPDPIQIFLNKLGSIKFIAYIFVLVFTLNGIATFTDSLRKITAFYRDVRATFRNQQFTDSELRERAIATARTLVEFVESRQANEPVFDFNKFTESSQTLIRYSATTQNEYVSRFGGQVAAIREEFLKRGMSNKELDLFYQNPTNYIGLRSVALALATLSEKLPK